MTDNDSRLWVDDDRQAPEGWTVAKTSQQAIAALETSKINEISLDYSLAYMDMDTTRTVVEWMQSHYFPSVIHVHTGSGHGREWLVEQIKSLAPGHLGNVYSALNSRF